MNRRDDEPKRWALPSLRRDATGRLVTNSQTTDEVDPPGSARHSNIQPSGAPTQHRELLLVLPSLHFLRWAITQFKRLLPKLRHFKNRRYLVSFAAAFVIVGIGLLYFRTHTTSQTATVGHGRVAGAETNVSAPTRGTPSYATVLPSGKTISQLGGWYRISPPDRNPVYAFSDHIGDVQLAVSEQPLPSSFVSDTTDGVANLAQSFSATEKLTIGDTTAYIGTSAQGPQSVIYSKNNLLILIKSTDVLTANQWATYISQLD